MLKIPLITKSQEFFNFVEEFIASDKTVVVCPNPGIADSVRNRFDSMGKSANCLTISKFIREELNELIDESALENYRGKSELLLILGAVWKKLGKENSYTDFKKAFNLLTEFRSFSVSESVLETVLENYEEDLSHGVLWLNRFIDQLGLVDEHGSYFMLSETLREGDIDPAKEFDRHIIFYGFDHLTGSQVDLLKSFALRDDVYIPFYKSAYSKSIGTDWIKWFDDHNLEVFDCFNNETKGETSANLIRFSKGYLKEYLNLDHTFTDVILGAKNLTREDIQEIDDEKMKYKTSVDMFSECFKELEMKLENFINAMKPTQDVNEFLKNEALMAAETQNFRYLKVCSIFLAKLKEWTDLSSDIDGIEYFDFQVFMEATLLDLPRINFASVEKKFETTLRSFREIEDVKNKEVCFCLSSSYSSLTGGSSNYSENVEKYLGSIGPIRRGELEKEIIKSKLKEFVEDNQVTFIIENNLIEHNPNLNALFSLIEFNELDKNFNKKPREIKTVELDFTDYKVSSLSASKLQQYYDCPRKFALNYIEKISPRYELPGKLSVLDLGRVEHLVIESYFKMRNDWDETAFIQLVEKICQTVTNEDKAISQENFVEILAYTKKTIILLVEMKENLFFDYSFEKPFSLKEFETKLNGSIDLFATRENRRVILDFKRSNSSFTSIKMVKEFEQIQLWFYLMRLINDAKIDLNTDEVCIGYIDLSNIENSTFFTNSKELGSDLKKLNEISKVQVMEDFEDHVLEFKEFESKLIEKLKQDKNFIPEPKNQKACMFCSIAEICPKGEINGNS